MVGAIAIILVSVVASLGWMPSTALGATNFTIDEVSTDLQVRPNGSVYVVSRQVLDFRGINTGYTWYLHRPESGESLKIDGIRVAPVDDGGTPIDGWTRLQMFDVNTRLQGSNPGDSAAVEMRAHKIQPWYSFSISDGMVRSYFPAEDGTYMIEAAYTLTNAVDVYRDIAELSWRYVHGSLPVDSSDVTLQINLPVPQGVAIQSGVDVVAWGHGPNDGSFMVNPDGTIIYQIQYLETGNYGEAHVIFPASWMTAMNPKAPHLYTEVRRPAVLAEEGQWVDEAARQAQWDNKVRMLFLSIAAIILLVGVVLIARYGLSARSRRGLIRVACTLFVVGLIAQLFFREILTVTCLLGAAAVVAIASLFLPKSDAEAAEDGLAENAVLSEEADEEASAVTIEEGEGHDDLE